MILRYIVLRKLFFKTISLFTYAKYCVNRGVARGRCFTHVFKIQGIGAQKQGYCGAKARRRNILHFVIAQKINKIPVNLVGKKDFVFSSLTIMDVGHQNHSLTPGANYTSYSTGYYFGS